MKNICLLFCLICIFVCTDAFIKEDNLLSISPNKHSRFLQNSSANSNSNCQVQDQVLPQYCIKCIDLFLLPDCQSCPVGYKIVNNQCIECGPHQLFCESSNPIDYCYQGFTQIGSDCICEVPKQIYSKWCTQLTDLIYEATYQNGEIVAFFSVNISLGDSSITNYSNTNCRQLTNFYTDYGGQEIIQCALNSQNRNQFHISLNNTNLDSKVYQIIPKFNYSQITLVDNNLNQFQATSITYQNQQLSSLTQFVYYQINDFTTPQCFFEYPDYYYYSTNDNYSIISSQFIQINNYFANANPQFSISSSQLLQQSDLQQISQDFTTFPSKNVQLPKQFAITGTTISINSVCLFPYNLISSSVSTFTTENSVNTQCQTYIINKKYLTNSDQIQISVNCRFNDFTANSQTPILFQYNITSQNYANSQIAYSNTYVAYQNPYQSYNLSPQIQQSQTLNLQINQFPYTITLPPYTLQPGIYYFQVYNYSIKFKILFDLYQNLFFQFYFILIFLKQTKFQGAPAYSTVQGVSNIITLNISKAPLIVQVIGGNQVGLDPRIPFQIQGYVNNPAIQSQDPSQSTYLWSCIDLNSNQTCLDSWSNLITFPQTQSITINPEVFDFGGSYQITLTGGYQSTQDSGIDVVIYRTKPATISAQYDQSYDFQQLNPSLTQKFLLQYSDSSILLSSNLTNSYTKTFQNQTIYFPQQRETTIYSQINYLLPDQILASSFIFYYRFFAFDQHNQTVAYSKRYYFQTANPPQGCQINFLTPITGQEVAFVNLISLSIDNCQSSDNSQLLYQFLYYNSAQLINQEEVQPDILYRQYLNKFSSNNTISTYLPPGNLVFVVLVQDKNGVQAQFQQTITILQNDFGEQQHENFITQMNQQAQNYRDQQEYENELCTFGIVVECIHNFESSNPDIVPTPLINNFKQNMKNQLLILPNLIPDDIFSQSLQEFNFRCLQNLYLTKNSPDYQNLPQRIEDVQSLVTQITQQIQQLNLTQDLRETYKRSMLILCNITGQTIQMLTSSVYSSPSFQWSQDRINNFLTIQDAMSFVLQNNQKRISWDMPDALIQAQRVDEFNLFKNYLDYDQKLYDQKDFNLNKIYYSQMQYWKTNIYSFDQEFIGQYYSYLAFTNSQNLKYALQQVYPAIYPNITLISSNKRHLQQQLTLNQTALIKMQFTNLQGNNKVNCIQRSEDNKWTKSTCITKTTNQGDSFSVTCSCSQAHYTSLVADVEALFDNQNLENIFSQQGLKSIINMNNWYEYACIYIIILLNILMVVSIIFGIKLDKINIYQSGLCTLGRSTAIFEQSTKIQISKYIAYLNAQLTQENQLHENTPIQPENANNNNQIQQKLDNEIQGVNYVGESQICKDYQQIQADKQVQQQVQYQQIQKEEQQQETQQQQNQKLELYQKIQYQEAKLQEKEKSDNSNQIVTSSECYPNAQYRINYQECQDHQTHIFKLLESIKKQQSISQDKSCTENVSKSKIKKDLQLKFQQQREEFSQKKFQEYLVGLTMLKGVCVFHDLIQIFMVYNISDSRLCRICLFYNQIIWLLTINSVFGGNLTVPQVIALSIVSSILFGILYFLTSLTILSSKNGISVGRILYKKYQIAVESHQEIETSLKYNIKIEQKQIQQFQFCIPNVFFFGSQKYYKWCTQLTDIIYEAVYSQGQVLVTFSVNIKFGGNSDFIPSNANCQSYLYNFSSDYQNNPIIQCSLDPQNQNQFHISFSQTDLTIGIYKVIPQFNQQQILVVDDQNNQIPVSSITYQNLQLSDQTQYVYHGISDFSAPQCYFTSPEYYFFSQNDNYQIIPPSQFVQTNQYFTNAQPFVQIVKSQGLQNSDINDINENIQAFPSFNVQLPTFAFQQEGTSVQFSVVCSYPYGMISSSIASYTTEVSTTTNCVGSILNTAPITNADQVELSINCSFSDFQANPLTPIQFQYIISNKTNGNIIKQSSLNLQLQQFPYKLTFDSFTFNQGSLNFFGESQYQSVKGNSFNLQFNIQRKSMVVKIIGGEKNQIDPRQPITISGEVSNPAIQNQDPSKYIYIWSCFDLILNQGCQDVWSNQINFPSEKSITIMPEVLDFSGSYEITLNGFYQGTMDSGYDSTTYQTLMATLVANYDTSYDQIQLNPNQLLQFALDCTQTYSCSQQNLNYTYQKTYKSSTVDISSSTLSFKSQREPTIFSKINEQMPDEQLSQSFQLYYRFYAIDQSNKQVAMSKRYYFTTASPPFNCEITFTKKISGNEIAFVDQISISVDNCQSVDNSQLYYQFLYYNQADQLNEEQQFPEVYYRQYLSKFSTSNSITTFLPPGKIVFIVLVKDSNDIQIKYSNPITILQNSFNQQQYETFLLNQSQLAQNLHNHSKFEEELCTYGMMIQCIQNFEKINPSQQPSIIVSEYKEMIKNELLILPNNIPNDSLSQSLQEFDARCLENLYNTINSPDSENQNDRLNNIERLLLISTKAIYQFKSFTQDLRETYRRSNLIFLNMLGPTMENLTYTVNNTSSIQWNKHRISDVFLIQDNIAKTFYPNQPSISWETTQVSIFVQKLDEKLLFQYYLSHDGKDNVQINPQNIYDLEIQYWKSNIYSFEQSYIDQYQQYLLLTNSSNLKDELKKTYPAINPKLSIASSSRRLQQQNANIDLPAPMNLQFQNIKGNSKVVCTQRQEDGSWTKSFCTSKTVKQGDTFSTTCTCSKPNFTTLIADIESLFDNQNLKNMFSDQGVKQIISLDDWYNYACIYVLIIINVLMIGSLVFVVKLDKADQSNIFIGINTIGKSIFTLEENVQKIEDIQKQQTTGANQVGKNSMQKYEDQIFQNVNSKRSQQSPIINQVIPDALQYFQPLSLQNCEIKNQFKETETGEKNLQTLNKSLQIDTNAKEYDDKQNFNTLTKTEVETNVQIGFEIEAIKSEGINLYEKYRINFKECQNHDQHKIASFDDLSKAQDTLQNDEDQSRLCRLSIFYNQLIWLLTINSVFGKDLSFDQLLALSIIASTIFVQCKLRHQQNDISKEFLNENRKLQLRVGASSNCQIYDQVRNDICLKCFDKFLLPDCTSCPVGYQAINNLCVQCGSNQLFCGSPSQSDYCYQGFTKIGADCACESPNKIYNKWCTQFTDLIYSALYSQGQVTVTFSVNIQFGGKSDYTPSNTNCLNYLSNFSTDYLNNQIIQCSLDSKNNNLFLISVCKQFQFVILFIKKISQFKIEQTDLTQGVYKIIPQFNQNTIFVVDNQNNKIAVTSITYQKMQLSAQSQYVYHGISDFTAPQSYFTSPEYYFFPNNDNYIINSSQFVQQNNYFTNSQPTKQIIKSSGLQDSDISQILESMSSFPNYSVELPITPFAQIGASLTIAVVSPFPYDMISSSTASYTTETSVFTNCIGQILNTAPLTNADQIQISIDCKFSDFQANPLTSISFTYTITEKKSGNLMKQTSLDLQIQQFPYKLTLDSFFFVEGDYNFNVNYFLILLFLNQFLNIKFKKGISSYHSIQGLGFNLSLSIKRKSMVVQIVGGAKNQIDPRQAITLQGEISDPAIQNQDPTQYTYIWSCFDLILNQNCQDAWFNQISFPSASSITIMPEVFDFGGSYQIKLTGGYQGTQDTATDIVNYQALPAALVSNYDASYEKNLLNPRQLLQFSLDYRNINSYLQQNLNYTYSKTYQSTTLTFQSQRETTIFSQIDEKLPDSVLASSFKLYYRFYAIEQNNKQVAMSKRYYFTTAIPPNNCEIDFNTQISGNEVAFVDQISIQVKNCQSSDNSQLYYQFLYYNQAEQMNKEQQFPEVYYRQYLSKFSTDNSITTFLPPGQIVFIVLVKDQNDIQIRYSNPITIAQNSFTQQQYELFLNSQNQVAQNFQSNSKFEEQLCSYGMMIQCIQNFEKTNSNLLPTKFVSGIKENMKKQLLLLPNQIPNDSLSQSLQEFDARCLQNLYSTKNSPDSENQVNRLSNIESLLTQNTQILSQLKPFTQDLRETYRRSNLIMLSMLGQAIDTLTSTDYNTPSIEWNKRRIDDIFQIQVNIALTFYANQPSIFWDTPQVSVFVQKLDEKNLFQYYLSFDNQNNNIQPNSNKIYDLQIQYWKTNIYSFEQSYIDQYQKYLLLTNSQNLKDQLQQIYPAINPKLGMASSSRRLQQQNTNIDLPAPINLQFQNIKGNNKVVCTQRQDDGSWVKSFCTSKTVKQGDTFTTTCTCSKPNFTTLIADVESLFENQNLQNIFSEQGVKQISNLDDWYKYACIYILIFINILMIGSFVFGCRLDKADQNNTFIGISTIGKSTTIQEESQKKFVDAQKLIMMNDNLKQKQQDQTLSDTNQKKILSNPISNQQTPPHDTQRLQPINPHSFEQKKDPLFKETQTEGKNMKILNKSIQIEIDIKENYNEQNQNTLAKTEAETNVQICIESEIETNKSDEKNPNDQFRINYQECQNREQHNFAIFEDSLKVKDSPQSDEEQQKKQSELTKKQIKLINEQLKQIKNIEIQQKSYEYLSSISIFRGVCVFHDIIQIFIIFDKNESRLCRLSIFYNQLIWLLTINSIFGKDLSIDQLLVLSIIASSLFGIFKILLKFVLNKQLFKIVGYFLIFCFLVFCYYAILVAMSNQSPSDSNIWIENYLITLAIDIFIWSTVSSFFKYLATLKLLPKFTITHFIYKFTSASTIFSIYE
ncbi:hypothetical protein ABPG74_012222 [Tetrahymena malaccensis]